MAMDAVAVQNHCVQLCRIKVEVSPKKELGSNSGKKPIARETKGTGGDTERKWRESRMSDRIRHSFLQSKALPNILAVRTLKQETYSRQSDSHG